MDDQTVNTVPKQVFLLRHAENVRDRSNPDVPLSEKGMEQAGEMARYIAGFELPQPCIIFYSPFRRSFQTASAIQQRLIEKPGNQVHMVETIFLAEYDPIISFVKAFHTLLNLDNPGEFISEYPGGTPAGTCFWIGHGRNMLTDSLEIIFNPVAAIERLFPDNIPPVGWNVETLLNKITDPGFVVTLKGGQDPYEDHGIAHLSRWQLNSPLWDSYTGETAYAAKLAEVSFASLPAPQVVPVPG